MSDERDIACVRFLQWALPRLSLRWKGFRKPRRQVCRRLLARCGELGLDLEGYRELLEKDADEWRVLAPLCRVTISRFRRDHSVWDLLLDEVLPALSRPGLRAWSCGCASGEEAGTLSITWRLGGFEGPLEVLGTDIDPVVLARARTGRYPAGVLRELPDTWRQAAFRDTGEEPDRYELREPFRRPLVFELGDVRLTAPAGPFDLVLCRNLAFTYFDDALQREVLERLLSVLRPGGALVIGRSERLPERAGLKPWNAREGVYRYSTSR